MTISESEAERINKVIHRFFDLATEDANSRGEVFVIDSNNAEAITDILVYFTDIPGRLNKKKGIHLVGESGPGKSTIMRTISKMMSLENPLSFQVHRCLDIRMEFAKNGYENLDKFYRQRICFDGIGEEPTQSGHYSNAANIIKEIIMARESLYQDKGIVTHFTSNLNRELAEQCYGIQGYGRIVSMTNTVILKGPNRRLNA